MSLTRWASLTAIALLSPSTAHADDADPVVVHVGPAALHVSDVTRRLAQVPAHQLRTLGGSPDEIKHRFVDTVLVPELLRSQEAERLALAQDPAVRRRIRDGLKRTLTDAVRKETLAAGVAEPDLRAYYDAHLGDFQKPERLRLQRILVDDEALARRILTEAKGPGGPERWSRLARENSVDSATKMRSGMLGFVMPDGHTDVPQVQVDPVLYAAAARVKDGELVPQPVKEGARFAVVWRRGTLPKLERTFEAERNSIRDSLVRERTERTMSALIDDLRKREVKDLDPSALESLPKEEKPPGAPPRKARPKLAGSASPVPLPTDRGLR